MNPVPPPPPEPEELVLNPEWLQSIKSGDRYRPETSADYGMRDFRVKHSDRDIWARWRKLKFEKARRTQRQEERALYAAPDPEDEVASQGGPSKSRRESFHIDYARAGSKIAKLLEEKAKTGGGMANSHLDVVHNLSLLEKVWLKASERGYGLNEEEFVDFLSHVLSMPEEQLSILFQKMDANSDGTLTWDEYLSYLLREVTHNWHFRSARGTWHLRDVDTPALSIGNVVNHILVLPSDSGPGKYVFGCKDNTIQVWNSKTLTYHSTLPAAASAASRKERKYGSKGDSGGSNSHRSHEGASHQTSGSKTSRPDLGQRGGGRGEESAIPFASKANIGYPVTSIAYAEAQRQIVVSTLDKYISFYQLANRQYKLADSFCCHDTPQCMTVAHTPTMNKDLLIIGDTTGKVSAYSTDYDDHRILETLDAHAGDSVRRVSLVPNVGLISAGMDARLVITDPERWQVVRTMKGHKRGVYSFANCHYYRCVLSAGFDRKVLVWDPYISTPTGSLGAHHTNILDVVVNEDKNQIITTCADKKIKVFDIRTFKCIQSLVDTAEYHPNDELSAVAFDHELQWLVTVGNKIRTWPVNIAPGNKAQKGGPAHSNLVVAIHYSGVFRQIVSVGVDGNVRLWDIYTGVNVFEFNTDHDAPITAACLDNRGKRLITGSHDGTAKMWNFNNGACMWEFKPRAKELSELIYLSRSMNPIVGVGWEPSVTWWPDGTITKNTEILVPTEHSADITCVSCNDALLVTGSIDGEIIMWYVDSARVNKRFRTPVNNEGKRCGVSQLEFVHFPVRKYDILVIAGDDGSVHFLEPISGQLKSMPKRAGLDEMIVGLAILGVPQKKKVLSRKSKVDTKDTAEKPLRLMAAAEAEAKVWDIKNMTPEGIMHMKFKEVRAWDPHPSHTTQDVTSILDIQLFATCADSGEIKLWTNTGDTLCQFGQRKTWPVPDPRILSQEDIDQHETGQYKLTDHAEDDDSEDSDTPRGRKKRTGGESPEITLESYTKIHPTFVPKTLTKYGLRTAGFNLSPMPRHTAPDTQQSDDDKPKTRLHYLLQQKDEERSRHTHGKKDQQHHPTNASHAQHATGKHLRPPSRDRPRRSRLSHRQPGAAGGHAALRPTQPDRQPRRSANSDSLRPPAHP